MMSEFAGRSVQLTKLLDEYILCTDWLFDRAIENYLSSSLRIYRQKLEIGSYLVRDVRTVSVSVKASAGANYGR